MEIKILIVDDHGVLRAGLRALLNNEEDMQVVGEAESGEQALQLTGELQPQVVLMDISMPGMNGIQATRELLRHFPGTAILLLTIHEDEALLREALEAGVAGYILKRAVESELTNAIHSVAAGDLYVHPPMTRALLAEPAHQRVTELPEATLTAREVEVLRMVAQGYTNRQIAEMLHISVRTVESHRANLMAKLNLQSRVELVRYASERGWLDLDNAKGKFNP